MTRYFAAAAACALGFLLLAECESDYERDYPCVRYAPKTCWALPCKPVGCVERRVR